MATGILQPINRNVTFLLVAQNLQSVADGGRTWLTISLCTGTFSFFKDACNREDSLTAITLHKKPYSHKWLLRHYSESNNPPAYKHIFCMMNCYSFKFNIFKQLKTLWISLNKNIWGILFFWKWGKREKMP